MNGIEYVTTAEGKHTAVVDLDQVGEAWEDFLDILVCLEREGEETIPWEQVKVELVAEGKLDA